MTVSTVALILAVIGLGHESQSRRDAARDSCYLLRGLVTAATTQAPAQRAASNAYIARTQLHNCNGYARSVVK
jgi:hypothetical protein